MPRTREQFREMREKSRKTIMETALKLFSTHGYHKTSISKIAGEAGIATGLVYNYFSSKEELLEEIIKEALDDFNRLLKTKTKGLQQDNDPAGMIEAIFASVKYKREPWRLFVRILMQPEASALGDRIVGDFLGHMVLFFKTNFAQKGEADPEKKAKALGGLLHGAILSYILGGDEEEFELIKNELIQKFL